MHTGIGVIHNDLHLNNVTINTTPIPYVHYDKKKNIIDSFIPDNITHEQYVAYQIESKTFALPFRTTSSCIIDFSRSIIKPNESTLNYFTEHGFSQLHEQRFYQSQRVKAVDKLSSLFPTFWSMNIDKLHEFTEINFEKFFVIYSAIDIYDFASRSDKYYKTAPKQTRQLFKKMVKISEYYLTKYLAGAIKNPSLKPELPIYTIALECFSEYLYEGNEQIVFLWDGTRKPIFNYDSFETAPLQTKTKSEYEKLNRSRKEANNMITYIAKRHKIKYG